MYKRKTKSSNLGIVRTINKPAEQNRPSHENSSPNTQTVLGLVSKDDNSITNKSLCNTSVSKGRTKPANILTPNSLTKSASSQEDPDEVLSDSEPSPKRLRTFFNSSSLLSASKTSNRQEEFVVGQSSSSTKPPNSDIKKSIRPRPTENLSNLSSKVNEKPATQQKESSPMKILLGKPCKNSVKTRPERNKTKRFADNFDRPNNGTLLEDLCEKSGFILSDGNSPNILKTDQAIFIRDITDAITCDETQQKRIVEQIMKDLEENCNSNKCFKYAVSYTETASECDVSRGATQDCLMRLLLHVDCLQAQVTELLMDKLGLFVMNGSSDDDNTPPITWVRMILQCFRFLHRMLDANLVNERLLDIILATSDVTIQQEVILSLPDIIGDAEHHHTALELSKLVRKSSPQLMACALEALTNLSLQPEVRAQIQPILIKALHKVQPEFLPTMLKFLFTDCDVPLVDEIITHLRNELDLSQTSGDTSSFQVLVASTLRDALLSSRTLPNIWQKNISSVKTQAEHKPIDMIVLLILMSTTNDPARQRSIEAIFRNKIRSDMFTESLINETFKSYISVIKEYFNVTTKLAGALLKSSDPTVIEFASKMYIGMFVNMDGLWCKWVLSELQVCVGAGDANVARAALNVLQHLTNSHHHKVKPLGVILMQLLNKLNDLALGEVCQLMDILCNIAYSEDDRSQSDCSILQDEINILVQKQLASSQLSVLRNGVVGCVMTIKHIVARNESSSESSSLDETTDKAKKAIQLLEMLLTSTMRCVEVHGLALDQLAHLLISANTLDQSFVQKLSSLMRDNLQDAFLISHSDFVAKDDVIKSSLQFYLDDDDEGAIALNISELAAVESDPTKPRPMIAVSCLHPLLRLLRGLEMSDLSEIDALLGCYIAMPVPAVYSDFSQLSPYQQHVALHCLFHCINWLHEVINCFAYLVKKGEPEKVLIRLRTVVWLRGLLARCLPLAMEYIPPMCHFQALPKLKGNSSEKGTKKKTKKRGKRKTKKKKQENDQTVLTGTVNTSQQDDEEEDEEEEENVEEKCANLSKYKLYFRELDIDVWLILTQPLTLSPTPEKNGSFTAELGPSELLLLLEDYVIKLSRSLNSSNKRMSCLKTANQTVGFENLDKFTPQHLAKNTIKLLPYLCSFLEKTVEYTRNLVTVNDGILDATGMFMEGSAEIKTCQGKLLRVLAILFSWVGFQNQINNNLLLAGLQKLASRVNNEQDKNKSKKLMIRDCVQYLTQCHEHVLDLTSACTLVDLIRAVVHHADNNANLATGVVSVTTSSARPPVYTKYVCGVKGTARSGRVVGGEDADPAEWSSICDEFLRRQWYDLKGNREKGAVLNGQLTELLSGYLSLSEDQLTAVTSITTWLSAESQQLSEKDSSLTTFPAFSRNNLHLLIGGVLRGLEGAVKQKLDNQLTDKEQLELWSSFTQCLETLVNIVKAHDTKPNLRAFMKGCTIVLRLFLSNGMTTCTFMFKHEPALVSNILKKLQITTRYIQTICNFVKMSKDTGLTQFLPAIRAVLETILLRVKSIIVINNCADAFFMGSMKNRDLKGQEIPSQEENDVEEEASIENEAHSESDKDDENSENEETDNEEIEEASESISI